MEGGPCGLRRGLVWDGTSFRAGSRRPGARGWTLAVLALCLVHPVSAAGQSARQGLPVAPADVFPTMLTMADRGDWTGLGRALDMLAPLLDEIDRTDGSAPGAALRAAVTDRAPLVPASVRRLILASVKQALQEACMSHDATSRRVLVRVSFSEFIVLKPALREENFRAVQGVEAAFRRVHALSVGGGAELERACEATDRALGGLSI